MTCLGRQCAEAGRVVSPGPRRSARHSCRQRGWGHNPLPPGHPPIRHPRRSGIRSVLARISSLAQVPSVRRSIGETPGCQSLNEPAMQTDSASGHFNSRHTRCAPRPATVQLVLFFALISCLDLVVIRPASGGPVSWDSRSAPHPEVLSRNLVGAWASCAGLSSWFTGTCGSPRSTLLTSALLSALGHFLPVALLILLQPAQNRSQPKRWGRCSPTASVPAGHYFFPFSMPLVAWPAVVAQQKTSPPQALQVCFSSVMSPFLWPVTVMVSLQPPHA